MSLLTVKLLVTPLMVLAASLAARRWGDAIGGWLVGLPLTSGPVALFLAIERGTDFASRAAGGSLAGVAAQAAFCVAYMALASRGLMAALTAAGVAYVGSAAALVTANLSRPALFLVAVGALTAVLTVMPRKPVAIGKAVGWRDVAARMATTTALVVGLTSAASALGPQVSGATASFPVIGASMAAFAHRGVGPAAAVAVMRGMISALYAFAALFLVLGATLTRLPLAEAFALATAAALIAQGATLRLARSHSPSKSPAAPPALT
jgi:hypothetical protein